MEEKRNSSSISSISDLEEESDDLVLANERQCELSQMMAPDLPREFSSVAVKDSTDVTFGSKINFIGPVTIKKLIVDKSDVRKENIQESSNYFDKEKEEQDLFDEKLFLKKKIWKKKLVLWIVLGISTLAVLITALALSLEFKFKKAEEVKFITPSKGTTLKTPELTQSLEIVNRSQWFALPPKFQQIPLEIPSKYVIISHTAGSFCFSKSMCSKATRRVQSDHMVKASIADDIGYNFLIGGDGRVYEGRGWYKKGAHTSDYNDQSIGIGFIGNFNKVKPPEIQVKACELLLKEGVQLGVLDHNYKLYGQRQMRPFDSPGDKLYEIIKKWPNWSKNLPETF